jgi:esterase/lipase superfamily enzyme
VRPEYAKVLVTSVDAESAWHYTTRPKDRARREKAIERYGRQEAFARLAANGTAK